MGGLQAIPLYILELANSEQLTKQGVADLSPYTWW